MILLSETLRIIFPVITLIAGGYMGYKIYQTGYDDGKRSAGAKAPERRPVFNFGKKAEPVKNSPYYDDILRNIEIYDGTDNGQREVRSK